MKPPPLELQVDGNELHERVQADLARRLLERKEHEICELVFGPRPVFASKTPEGTVQRVSLAVQRGDRPKAGSEARRGPVGV